MRKRGKPREAESIQERERAVTAALDSEATRKKLYGTALRILRNPEDADDATQDGMMNAYKNRSRFAGRSSISTWLMRIVMNASFMRYRREHKHAVKGTEASPDSFHSHDPSPEKFFYLQEAVELALRAMSVSYRGVFLLRYRDGYSTLETSLISDLPMGTVKAMTHRARMKAISALEKKPSDTGEQRD